MNTMTPEQIVTKARVALMNDDQWRWMAGVMSLGTVSFVEADHPRIHTAATDGLHEVYNKAFIAGLNPQQVKFLVLHENYHKLFRHLYVWQNLWKTSPQLANIACDTVINNQQLMGKPGIEFIPGGVDLPQYADETKWNAKAIFDDLLKNAKNIQYVSDTHMWEEAESVSPEEAKKIEKQIDVALRQAKLAGSIGGNMPRSIKQMLVPEVDWKTLLADFIKAACAGRDKQTWRRPHKTYLAYDMYIPDNYSEDVERIAVFGDTSGSIDNDTLSVFMGYVQQLCDEVHPNGLDIAWWDTAIASVDRFERNALHGLANVVRPVGGGGTQPKCCADWLQKQPANKYACAIVLTDGVFFDDPIGQWDIPVLWLVVNNNPIKPIPVGMTVQVGELK